MIMITPEDLLPIIVDSQSPIAINAQIAEQIKILIAVGQLQSGEALPTVTQLAKYLKVNHNTIAAVYNSLIESGYLVAQRGKGTFVARSQAVQKILTHRNVYNLLGQAFTAAAQVGLSASEFGAAAYAQAVRLSQHSSVLVKLVFVEGFPHNGNVCEAIQSEIGCNLSVIPWEDLKANQSKALEELLAADMVITTLQYLWNVTQITAPEQEVIAVDIKPDIELLTQISSLPRRTRMLLVCREEANLQIMKQMLELSGISHLNFQVAEVEYLQKNSQIWEQVDAVCASMLVYHHVRQFSPQPEKVMVFNFSLDQTNMSVLKARLSAIQLAKSTASLEKVYGLTP